MVDYTLTIVLLGSTILGIAAGCLGVFAVLRKQSLLGDAISHAALPGIALAFFLVYLVSKHSQLLLNPKNPLLLLFGAFVAGMIGTGIMLIITRKTTLKEDAALGIVLSVLFGIGIVFLSIIQRLPTSEKSGLDSFLFGQAATLLRSEVVTMAVLSVIVLVITYLFYKELKVMTFDRGFARSLGFSSHTLDILLLTLIVSAIVIGLQTVGVVLMSALLIAPAVAARQWTDSLGKMIILSGVFGAISGVVGVWLSSLTNKMPTGPVIVIVVSVLVILSLLFSPHRGLVHDWLRYWKQKRSIHIRKVLCNLYFLAQGHRNPHHAHDIASLKAVDETGVERSLDELQTLGFVFRDGAKYSLTKRGLKEVRSILSEVA